MFDQRPSASPIGPTLAEKLEALRVTSQDIPAFARNYAIRRETDGRVFLVAEVEGCVVYVQPKSWKDLTVSDPQTNTLAANYGLDLAGLNPAQAGTLTTNDASAGELVFGEAGRLDATASTLAADPHVPATSAEVESPTTIAVAVALAVAGLVALVRALMLKKA